MRNALSQFEEQWSTGISDAFEYLQDEPTFFSWLLLPTLLVAAGLVTLLYLTIKLFIPRRHCP